MVACVWGKQRQMTRKMCQLRVTWRCKTAKILKVFKSAKNQPTHEACVELDSHTDTFLAGHNCLLMSHTKRVCDVMPHSDDCEPKKAVPIAQVAIGCASM